MKESICTFAGLTGSIIAGLFGGWDTAISTLLLFMVIDYVTGLMVAGIFKKSPKTKSGGLQSKIGWKGLAKKVGTLLMVLVAVRIDLLLGTSYVRDGVCIAFILNEAISITENYGLMGGKMPVPLQKAIDLLQDKTGKSGEGEEHDKR